MTSVFRSIVFPARVLLVWTFAVGLAAAMPGCVKFKSALTVQPDGSGKVELTFGLSDAMMDHRDPDDFGLADLDDLIAQEGQGFVAFTAAEVYTEDGYTFQRITGYFEDIRALVLQGDEVDGEAKGGAGTTFAFDPEGSLTVSRSMLQQVALEVEGASDDAAERAATAMMLGGLKIEESVTLPGVIEGDAGPFAVAGDTAAGWIDEAAMLDETASALSAWRDADEVTLRFRPRAWSSEQRSAWQAEVEAAKAAWATMKASGGSDGPVER